MHYRIIDKNIKVYLTTTLFTDELFHLTNKNRNFLRKWLPWIDSIKEPNDTNSFILSQLENLKTMKSLHQTIFYKEKIVGVLAYNSMENKTGIIGYWLAEEFNGKGIMTKCVEDLIEQGFAYYKLEKVEIRCAKENTKSQAIPKKLNMKVEKTIKDAEKLNGKLYDHLVYSIDKNSFYLLKS
ncbi:GNAT family N-acetyltransferase [Campylobacterota bacterium DY0563]